MGTAAFGQQSVVQPRTPASSGKAPLDTVTVEAQRERKELEREVNEFVFAVAVRSVHDSLSRWNTPVCPLVAGLPKEQGEFVLARLSQIATAAKAPLAGEHCTANFYVIVTSQPELLLKKWQARDRRMFDTRNGMGVSGASWIPHVRSGSGTTSASLPQTATRSPPIRLPARSSAAVSA
jgi:hypothetical protein